MLAYHPDIATDEMDPLDETVAILSDPTSLLSVREGLADVLAGDVEELTREAAESRWVLPS